MKAMLLLVASCALNCALTVSASAGNTNDSSLLKAGWIQSSPGVYTMTEDGVEYQLSMGTEGALHDIAKLNERYNDLALKSMTSLSSGDAQEVADLEGAIAGIPEKADGDISPMTTSSGTMCGEFNYYLDSHFVVGGIGAAAVSRAFVGELNFGAPVLPSAVSMHTSATVTPASGLGSTVSSAYTSSTWGSQPNVALASWQVPASAFGDAGPVTSSSCTASTYQYVSLTGGTCSPTAGFMSLTKSYPTCVSSP